MKLEGKVAIVTGSSRGIGRVIALRFAEEGANVVINYNKAETQAHETVKEVKALGNEAIVVKADITKGNDVKNLVKQTLERFGRIDVLVNNAGVIFGTSSLKEESEEIWDRAMDVNLKGPFLCSKEVGKVMVKQKSGRIINISSGLGIRATPETIHYNVSKAGVLMLTQCLALALAPYVRVNCIAPGFVEAGMSQNESEEVKRNIKNITPLKRLAQPEDIANACVFLASDDSSFITGQTILIDGGRLISRAGGAQGRW